GLFFPSRLLFFGIFLLPTLVIFITTHLWEVNSCGEMTASSHFLATQERIRNRSTNLLIFNDTGSEIKDFIAALKAQNITAELTLEKNITSLPQHNGAIKISVADKV
ncbi:ABCA9 protein, partial [Piaya cayana]|nr:ABCA9 protein [Piaya cayana]